MCICFSCITPDDEDMAQYNFILNLKPRYKWMLNDALSMERDHLGIYSTPLKCSSMMTNYCDQFISLFCCMDGVVSMTCDSFCFAAAKSAAILREYKRAEVGYDYFPANKSMVKLMAKTYYSDVYGIRSCNTKETETHYSPTERDTLIRLFKKIKDPKLGEKLIRILRIGSCDYQQTPNWSYRLFAAKVPCFTLCYGQSISLAERIVDYCQDVGVEYAHVYEVLSNFNKYWKEYMKDFLVRCVADNEVDVRRMSTGAHVDVTISKSVQKLKQASESDLSFGTKYLQMVKAEETY